METKDLIANLHEWHENLISEMCADDVLTCDDLCGYPGPCIVIQAANLLEAQQKRIAELEAALREQEERRWIPVTERLPDDSIPSTFYLCYWNGYIRVCKYWRARKVFELRGKTVKVTHWMPLPEPPKEDA